MVTWGEFAAASPGIAAFGRQRLRNFGVPLAFLATVTPDGGPRVHPVCPIFCGHGLFVSVGHDSPKVGDLRAHAGYMLHAFPDQGDPEFSIRGNVREVTSDDERAAVVAAIEFAAYDATDPIFEFRIARADMTTWTNFGTPEHAPVRDRWVHRGD